eukprot:6000933-Amphidinium_carterae.2
MNIVGSNLIGPLPRPLSRACSHTLGSKGQSRVPALSLRCHARGCDLRISSRPTIGHKFQGTRVTRPAKVGPFTKRFAGADAHIIHVCNRHPANFSAIKAYAEERFHSPGFAGGR